MTGRKENNTGLIGHSTKTGKQTPYLYPKTTEVPGGGVTIDLREKTGIDDLVLLHHSLDGRCWYGRSDTANRGYIITLHRDADGKMRYVQHIEEKDRFNADIVQAGRDWIMSLTYFYAASNLDGSVLDIQVRENSSLYGSTFYGMGYPQYDSGETRCLFYDYQRTSPPHWEQLNRVFGGFQVLHGWLVPRPDYGRAVESTKPGSAEARDLWSHTAIPYHVLETGPKQIPAPICYDMIPKMVRESGMRCSRFVESPMNQNGVFVVNDGLWVKSQNYAGHGIMIPSFMKLDEPGDGWETHFHPAYNIIQCNDYNVKKNNYPGFDWFGAIIGRLGDSVALIEIDRSSMNQRNPLAIAPLPTGRYIPLDAEVEHGSSDHPGIVQMTGPEQEEMTFYLNIAATGFDSPVVGRDDRTVVFISKKDGMENILAYRNAAAHFFPGGSALTGIFGRYLITSDNYKNTFITDSGGHLYRRLIQGTGTLSVEYNVQNGRVKNAAALLSYTASAKVSFDTLIQDESSPKYPSYEDEWKSADGNPSHFRLLQMDNRDLTGDYSSLAEVPVVFTGLEDLGWEAFYSEFSGTYPNNWWYSPDDLFSLMGRAPAAKCRYSFKRVDPDSGGLIPFYIDAGVISIEGSPTEGRDNHGAFHGYQYTAQVILPWWSNSNALWRSSIDNDSDRCDYGIQVKLNDWRIEIRVYEEPDYPEFPAIFYVSGHSTAGDRDPLPVEWPRPWICPAEMFWKGAYASVNYRSLAESCDFGNAVGIPEGGTYNARRIALADYCMTNEIWEAIIPRFDTITGGIPTLQPGRAVYPCFNMSLMDLGIVMRVGLNEEFMRDIIADSSYLITFSNRENVCVSRLHHNMQNYTSLVPQHYAPAVGGRIIAHYANADTFFEVRNLYYDPYGDQKALTVHRASEQMYVIHFAEGATYQENETLAPSLPFSKNYYAVIRCDVDVEKYQYLVDILMSSPAAD